MKNFFYWLTIAVCFILIAAYITKPSYKTCVTKISEDLNKAGFFAGTYVVRDDKTKAAAVKTVVTAKDRMFYWDIYFPIDGKETKVGIGAFTKIFKVN